MSQNPSTEPSRLLDDPAIDGLLRRDLELARAHAPVTYDASAGLARFERALASGVSAGASANASVATTGRVLGWIVGAAVLVGGVGGATWVMSQADVDQRVVANASPLTEEVRSEDAAVVGSASSSRGATIGARATVAEDRLEPEAEDAGSPDSGEVGGDSRAAASANPPRPSSKSSDAALPAFSTEAEAINAARKALTSDPARALSLIEAAAREFPDGALVQEREGYAILALLALGRRAEAEERAADYLERWPMGPLSRRVRDALDPE